MFLYMEIKNRVNAISKLNPTNCHYFLLLMESQMSPISGKKILFERRISEHENLQLRTALLLNNT